MKKTSIVCAAAALAAAGVLTTAARANAQAACSSYPNPVYIAGSTASKPVWAALSQADGIKGEISLIYAGPSSCVGLDDVTLGTGETTTAYLMDGTSLGTQCTPATGGDTIQIGVSDVFASTCEPAVAVPSGFADFRGPVQVMGMAVPYNSMQSSISADAAYTVFGWGGTQYPVATWTNYQSIFIRNYTSGTQLMIGSAIGLAATKWLSQTPDAGPQELSSSGKVLGALQSAAAGSNSSQAIGILAANYIDQYRGPVGTTDAGAYTGGLKILAYQAADQSCGYLPDSDATHLDKINVRQGRYDIWGQLHVITAVDGSGTPTNAQAATLINYLTASTTLTPAQLQTVIQADALAYVIPQCAMQVSRSAEVTPAAGGGMASYQPPVGCGCYYESLVNGGTPYSKYCQACSADAGTNGAGSCPSSYPKCNFGFCEVQ